MSRALAALLLGLLALLAFASSARAHEVRPASLEIRETAPDRYELRWRTPVLSGMPLPVVLTFPDGMRELGEPIVRRLPGSTLERRAIDASGAGQAAKRIEFTGLEATITDVVVRVERLDGTRSLVVVRPSRPWIELDAADPGRTAVARAFVARGIEHIALGFDHLLFVLALVLIVPSKRVLVATITSFTVAHSITLALATLGLVSVPGPPVEASIAASIVLLAHELVRMQRGEPTLTARRPWLVAFCFGLLHGFGFAGALSDAGLPQGEVPLALFAFNVGVELGQLAFVAGVLVLLALVRRLPVPPALARRALPGAGYAIGSLAAFWFFQRIAAF